MSKYTTGEIAKLCNVSVRTVQYYDSRNILVPSELSEGGRRLYSEDDLRQMQIICFLREMGFSIDNISKLLNDQNFEKVILMLIENQEKLLLNDIDAQQQKLQKLTKLKHSLKDFDNLTVNSLGDIAHIMKNQNKRKKLLAIMLVLGIIMDVIEVGSVIYGIKTGNWWPLVVGLPIVIALGVFISVYYYKHVAYICPVCHEVFKPRFGKMFWAAHTPNTRRLRCPKCNHKGFCIETYDESVDNKKA
ncbi:MAG: MerR family transcriptional regulator [Clostridia bacterium]|nr:MerR family transcriptional regulator [Clostridia bacterium]